MSELKNLLNDIEELKKNLLDLIEKTEGDLQDSDVIAASQVLNVAIVKYNELLLKLNNQ